MIGAIKFETICNYPKICIIHEHLTSYLSYIHSNKVYCEILD
jgi:hypothetical protein